MMKGVNKKEFFFLFLFFVCFLMLVIKSSEVFRIENIQHGEGNERESRKLIRNFFIVIIEYDPTEHGNKVLPNGDDYRTDYFDVNLCYQGDVENNRSIWGNELKIKIRDKTYWVISVLSKPIFIYHINSCDKFTYRVGMTPKPNYAITYDVPYIVLGTLSGHDVDDVKALHIVQRYFEIFEKYFITLTDNCVQKNTFNFTFKLDVKNSIVSLGHIEQFFGYENKIIYYVCASIKKKTYMVTSFVMQKKQKLDIFLCFNTDPVCKLMLLDNILQEDKKQSYTVDGIKMYATVAVKDECTDDRAVTLLENCKRIENIQLCEIVNSQRVMVKHICFKDKTGYNDTLGIILLYKKQKHVNCFKHTVCSVDIYINEMDELYMNKLLDVKYFFTNIRNEDLRKNTKIKKKIIGATQTVAFNVLSISSVEPVLDECYICYEVKNLEMCFLTVNLYDTFDVSLTYLYVNEKLFSMPSSHSLTRDNLKGPYVKVECSDRLNAEDEYGNVQENNLFLFSNDNQLNLILPYSLFSLRICLKGSIFFDVGVLLVEKIDNLNFVIENDILQLKGKASYYKKNENSRLKKFAIKDDISCKSSLYYIVTMQSEKSFVSDNTDRIIEQPVVYKFPKQFKFEVMKYFVCMCSREFDCSSKTDGNDYTVYSGVSFVNPNFSSRNKRHICKFLYNCDITVYFPGTIASTYWLAKELPKELPKEFSSIKHTDTLSNQSQSLALDVGSKKKIIGEDLCNTEKSVGINILAKEQKSVNVKDKTFVGIHFEFSFLIDHIDVNFFNRDILICGDAKDQYFLLHLKSDYFKLYKFIPYHDLHLPYLDSNCDGSRKVVLFSYLNGKETLFKKIEVKFNSKSQNSSDENSTKEEHRDISNIQPNKQPNTNNIDTDDNEFESFRFEINDVENNHIYLIKECVVCDKTAAVQFNGTELHTASEKTENSDIFWKSNYYSNAKDIKMEKAKQVITNDSVNNGVSNIQVGSYKNKEGEHLSISKKSKDNEREKRNIKNTQRVKTFDGINKIKKYISEAEIKKKNFMNNIWKWKFENIILNKYNVEDSDVTRSTSEKDTVKIYDNNENSNSTKQNVYMKNGNQLFIQKQEKIKAENNKQQNQFPNDKPVTLYKCNDMDEQNYTLTGVIILDGPFEEIKMNCIIGDTCKIKFSCSLTVSANDYFFYVKIDKEHRTKLSHTEHVAFEVSNVSTNVHNRILDVVLNILPTKTSHIKPGIYDIIYSKKVNEVIIEYKIGNFHSIGPYIENTRYKITGKMKYINIEGIFSDSFNIKNMKIQENDDCDNFRGSFNELSNYVQCTHESKDFITCLINCERENKFRNLCWSYSTHSDSSVNGQLTHIGNVVCDSSKSSIVEMLLSKQLHLDNFLDKDTSYILSNDCNTLTLDFMERTFTSEKININLIYKKYAYPDLYFLCICRHLTMKKCNLANQYLHHTLKWEDINENAESGSEYEAYPNRNLILAENLIDTKFIKLLSNAYETKIFPVLAYLPGPFQKKTVVCLSGMPCYTHVIIKRLLIKDSHLINGTFVKPIYYFLKETSACGTIEGKLYTSDYGIIIKKQHIEFSNQQLTDIIFRMNISFMPDTIGKTVKVCSMFYKEDTYSFDSGELIYYGIDNNLDSVHVLSGVGFSFSLIQHYSSYGLYVRFLFKNTLLENSCTSTKAQFETVIIKEKKLLRRSVKNNSVINIENGKKHLWKGLTIILDIDNKSYYSATTKEDFSTELLLCVCYNLYDGYCLSHQHFFTYFKSLHLHTAFLIEPLINSTIHFFRPFTFTLESTIDIGENTNVKLFPVEMKNTYISCFELNYRAKEYSTFQGKWDKHKHIFTVVVSFISEAVVVCWCPTINCNKNDYLTKVAFFKLSGPLFLHINTDLNGFFLFSFNSEYIDINDRFRFVTPDMNCSDIDMSNKIESIVYLDYDKRHSSISANKTILEKSKNIKKDEKNRFIFISKKYQFKKTNGEYSKTKFIKICYCFFLFKKNCLSEKNFIHIGIVKNTSLQRVEKSVINNENGINYLNARAGGNSDVMLMNGENSCNYLGRNTVKFLVVDNFGEFERDICNTGHVDIAPFYHPVFKPFKNFTNFKLSIYKKIRLGIDQFTSDSKKNDTQQKNDDLYFTVCLNHADFRIVNNVTSTAKYANELTEEDSLKKEVQYNFVKTKLGIISTITINKKKNKSLERKESNIGNKNKTGKKQKTEAKKEEEAEKKYIERWNHLNEGIKETKNFLKFILDDSYNYTNILQKHKKETEHFKSGIYNTLNKIYGDYFINSSETITYFKKKNSDMLHHFLLTEIRILNNNVVLFCCDHSGKYMQMTNYNDKFSLSNYLAADVLTHIFEGINSLIKKNQILQKNLLEQFDGLLYDNRKYNYIEIKDPEISGFYKNHLFLERINVLFDLPIFGERFLLNEYVLYITELDIACGNANSQNAFVEVSNFTIFEKYIFFRNILISKNNNYSLCLLNKTKGNISTVGILSATEYYVVRETYFVLNSNGINNKNVVKNNTANVVSQENGSSQQIKTNPEGAKENAKENAKQNVKQNVKQNEETSINSSLMKNVCINTHLKQIFIIKKTESFMFRLDPKNDDILKDAKKLSDIFPVLEKEHTISCKYKNKQYLFLTEKKVYLFNESLSLIRMLTHELPFPVDADFNETHIYISDLVIRKIIRFNVTEDSLKQTTETKLEATSYDIHDGGQKIDNASSRRKREISADKDYKKNITENEKVNNYEYGMYKEDKLDTEIVSEKEKRNTILEWTPQNTRHFLFTIVDFFTGLWKNKTLTPPMNRNTISQNDNTSSSSMEWEKTKNYSKADIDDENIFVKKMKKVKNLIKASFYQKEEIATPMEEKKKGYEEQKNTYKNNSYISDNFLTRNLNKLYLLFKGSITNERKLNAKRITAHEEFVRKKTMETKGNNLKKETIVKGETKLEKQVKDEKEKKKKLYKRMILADEQMVPITKEMNADDNPVSASTNKEVSEKSENGETGEKSEQGETGEKSEQGETGEKSEKGKTGEKGEKGEKSKKGKKTKKRKDEKNFHDFVTDSNHKYLKMKKNNTYFSFEFPYANRSLKFPLAIEVYKDVLYILDFSTNNFYGCDLKNKKVKALTSSNNLMKGDIVLKFPKSFSLYELDSKPYTSDTSLLAFITEKNKNEIKIIDLKSNPYNIIKAIKVRHGYQYDHINNVFVVSKKMLIITSKLNKKKSDNTILEDGHEYYKKHREQMQRKQKSYYERISNDVKGMYHYHLNPFNCYFIISFKYTFEERYNAHDNLYIEPQIDIYSDPIYFFCFLNNNDECTNEDETTHLNISHETGVIEGDLNYFGKFQLRIFAKTKFDYKINVYDNLYSLCYAGKEYNTVTNQCEDCPVGTFWNDAQIKCDRCEDYTKNTTTAKSGSILLIQCGCAPGYEWTSEGTCEKCKPNYYKSDVGNFVCISACSANERGKTYGSKSIEEVQCKCIEGFYKRGDICVECLKNHYCAGDDLLIPCKNHQVSKMGSTSIIDCKCIENFVLDKTYNCHYCASIGKLKNKPCYSPLCESKYLDENLYITDKIYKYGIVNVSFHYKEDLYTIQKQRITLTFYHDHLRWKKMDLFSASLTHRYNNILKDSSIIRLDSKDITDNDKNREKNSRMAIEISDIPNDSCSLCESGYFYNSEIGICEMCKNEYCEGLLKKPKLCSKNANIRKYKGSSNLDCGCEPGFGSLTERRNGYTNALRCDICPKNYFKHNTASHSCIPCPIHSYTIQEGESSISKCLPKKGYFFYMFKNIQIDYETYKYTVNLKDKIYNYFNKKKMNFDDDIYDIFLDKDYNFFFSHINKSSQDNEHFSELRNTPTANAMNNKVRKKKSLKEKGKKVYATQQQKIKKAEQIYNKYFKESKELGLISVTTLFYAYTSLLKDLEINYNPDNDEKLKVFCYVNLHLKENPKFAVTYEEDLDQCIQECKKNIYCTGIEFQRNKVHYVSVIIENNVKKIVGYFKCKIFYYDDLLHYMNEDVLSNLDEHLYKYAEEHVKNKNAQGYKQFILKYPKHMIFTCRITRYKKYSLYKVFELLPCLVGKFCPGKMNPYLVNCPENSLTFIPLAKSVTTCLCLPGHTHENLTAEACASCQLGTYKKTIGNEKCEICPLGFTTVAKGSTDIFNCSCTPGSFVDDISLKNYIRFDNITHGDTENLFFITKGNRYVGGIEKGKEDHETGLTVVTTKNEKKEDLIAYYEVKTLQFEASVLNKIQEKIKNKLDLSSQEHQILNTKVDVCKPCKIDNHYCVGGFLKEVHLKGKYIKGNIHALPQKCPEGRIIPHSIEQRNSENSCLCSHGKISKISKKNEKINLECISCPPSTFKENEYDNSCSGACPHFFTSFEGSSHKNQCFCSNDFYLVNEENESFDDSNEEKKKCRPCPKGAKCNRGLNILVFLKLLINREYTEINVSDHENPYPVYGYYAVYKKKEKDIEWTAEDRDTLIKYIYPYHNLLLFIQKNIQKGSYFFLNNDKKIYLNEEFFKFMKQLEKQEEEKQMQEMEEKKKEEEEKIMRLQQQNVLGEQKERSTDGESTVEPKNTNVYYKREKGKSYEGKNSINQEKKTQPNSQNIFLQINEKYGEYINKIYLRGSISFLEADTKKNKLKPKITKESNNKNNNLEMRIENKDAKETQEQKTETEEEEEKKKDVDELWKQFNKHVDEAKYIKEKNSIFEIIPDIHICTIEERCLGSIANLCEEGSTGYQCNNCEYGYDMSYFKSKCYKCDNFIKELLFILFIKGIYYAIIIIIVSLNYYSCLKKIHISGILIKIWLNCSFSFMTFGFYSPEVNSFFFRYMNTYKYALFYHLKLFNAYIRVGCLAHYFNWKLPYNQIWYIHKFIKLTQPYFDSCFMTLCMYIIIKIFRRFHRKKILKFEMLLHEIPGVKRKYKKRLGRNKISPTTVNKKEDEEKNQENMNDDANAKMKKEFSQTGEKEGEKGKGVTDVINEKYEEFQSEVHSSEKKIRTIQTNRSIYFKRSETVGKKVSIQDTSMMKNEKITNNSMQTADVLGEWNNQDFNEKSKTTLCENEKIELPMRYLKHESMHDLFLNEAIKDIYETTFFGPWRFMTKKKTKTKNKILTLLNDTLPCYVLIAFIAFPYIVLVLTELIYCTSINYKNESSQLYLAYLTTQKCSFYDKIYVTGYFICVLAFFFFFGVFSLTIYLYVKKKKNKTFNYLLNNLLAGYKSNKEVYEFLIILKNSILILIVVFNLRHKIFYIVLILLTNIIFTIFETLDDPFDKRSFNIMNRSQRIGNFIFIITALIIWASLFWDYGNFALIPIYATFLYHCYMLRNVIRELIITKYFISTETKIDIENNIYATVVFSNNTIGNYYKIINKVKYFITCKLKEKFCNRENKQNNKIVKGKQIKKVKGEGEEIEVAEEEEEEEKKTQMKKSILSQYKTGRSSFFGDYRFDTRYKSIESIIQKYDIDLKSGKICTVKFFESLNQEKTMKEEGIEKQTEPEMFFDIYKNILPVNTHSAALVFYDEENEDIYFQLPGETKFCQSFGETEREKERKKNEIIDKKKEWKKEQKRRKKEQKKRKKEQKRTGEKQKKNETENNEERKENKKETENNEERKEKKKKKKKKRKKIDNKKDSIMYKFFQYRSNKLKEKNFKYFVSAIMEIIEKFLRLSPSSTIFENWFDFTIRFVFVYNTWSKNLNKISSVLPSNKEELYARVDIFIFKPLFYQSNSFISENEKSKTKSLRSQKTENPNKDNSVLKKLKTDTSHDKNDQMIMKTGSKGFMSMDSLKKRNKSCRGDQSKDHNAESTLLEKLNSNKTNDVNKNDQEKWKHKNSTIIEGIESKTNMNDKKQNSKVSQVGIMKDRKTSILSNFTDCSSYAQKGKDNYKDLDFKSDIIDNEYPNSNSSSVSNHNEIIKNKRKRSIICSKDYTVHSTRNTKSDDFSKTVVNYSIDIFVQEMFNEINFKKLISVLEIYIAVKVMKSLDDYVFIKLYKLYNEKHNNYEKNTIFNINKLKKGLKEELVKIENKANEENNEVQKNLIKLYAYTEEFNRKKNLETDLLNKIKALQQCLFTKEESLTVAQKLHNLKKENKKKETKQMEEELNKYFINLLNGGGTYKLRHSKKPSNP